MERIYEFSLLRLSSTDARDERLNIGVVILDTDTLDVRLAKKLDKMRAMSGALGSRQAKDFALSLVELDRKCAEIGISDIKERLTFMVGSGPFSLSSFGTFTAESRSAYEARISSILNSLVEPESAPAKTLEKRSRLLAEVKTEFRHLKVLAKQDETIESHRIVQKYEIDTGLTADFALKNGVMHIVETVDATGDEHKIRQVVSLIGVSALVLQRAKMNFGENTARRLVYTASPLMESIARPSFEAAHDQGIQLTNWASADDRRKLVYGLSSLASPIVPKGKKAKAVAFGGGERFI